MPRDEEDENFEKQVFVAIVVLGVFSLVLLILWFAT
jgi:hypothetical protein